MFFLHSSHSLGALTRGDRRAAVVADLEEFNFDSVYGKQALKNMCNGIMTVGVALA